jgi:hypothetical protein
MCLIIHSGFSAQAEKAENNGFGRVRWNFPQWRMNDPRRRLAPLSRACQTELCVDSESLRKYPLCGGGLVHFT